MNEHTPSVSKGQTSNQQCKHLIDAVQLNCHETGAATGVFYVGECLDEAVTMEDKAIVEVVARGIGPFGHRQNQLGCSPMRRNLLKDSLVWKKEHTRFIVASLF